MLKDVLLAIQDLLDNPNSCEVNPEAATLLAQVLYCFNKLPNSY